MFFEVDEIVYLIFLREAFDRIGLMLLDAFDEIADMTWQRWKKWDPRLRGDDSYLGK
jgi:hypothetical protein